MEKNAYPFLKNWGSPRIYTGPIFISRHFSFLNSPVLALHSFKNHIHIQGFKHHPQICRCLGQRWSPPSPYSFPRQRNTHLMNGPLAKAGRIPAIWILTWVSPPTKQFSNTSWVSHKSSQFWHYLPGDRTRPHRLRAQSYETASHFRCQSQIQLFTCALTTWL